MPKRTLARHHRLDGSGWAHPYATTPWSPYLYADGGNTGGSESGSEADATGQQSTEQGGSQSGQTDSTGSGTGQGAGQQSGKGSAGDPAAEIERLKKDLADARKEAAKDRTTAKQQAADDAVKQLTEKLGKALGLVKEDTPPDPAALAKAIEQKDAALTEHAAQLRAKDIELAVWTRADKAGAKAAALLDSRSFLRAISGLDPTDKDFTSALDEAIKTAVKDNPGFAAQQASRSGGDLSGGTGESRAKRSGSLSGAVSHHYQT
ncbi:hypothetical protein ACFY7C_11955 [Streptomyces sp. NPDC012769]|uniref:hypothetical protein n=1 Tax=Streptomyces sp. NPDC012769 TaxID=3364848 RepID=UPI0036777B97